MAITTVFGSIGFAARFIIAFVIIAYIFSKDRSDQSVRRGFVLLCALGAAVFVLGNSSRIFIFEVLKDKNERNKAQNK